MLRLVRLLPLSERLRWKFGCKVSRMGAGLILRQRTTATATHGDDRRQMEIGTRLRVLLTQKVRLLLLQSVLQQLLLVRRRCRHLRLDLCLSLRLRLHRALAVGTLRLQRTKRDCVRGRERFASCICNELWTVYITSEDQPLCPVFCRQLLWMGS